MTNFVHKNDLPPNVTFKGDIAVDTEAMGLNNRRDRLCVVQLSGGDGNAHLIKFEKGVYDAPNLVKLLSDTSRTKIFHFARFDVGIIRHYLGVLMYPVYCTKIASRLCRTYTDRHSFKDLCREVIGVEISKQQQSSDWGGENLTQEQIDYAASDVLHLHKLRDALDKMLEREGRTALAKACFDFIPARAELDLQGWADTDIFAH